jgi:hypothetical protein
MALAAALADAPVVEALTRYDAARRLIGQALVAESRRLGAYIEGSGERIADPEAFMRANGGVEPSHADGGVFFRLLAEAGFGTPAFIAAAEAAARL